MYFPIKFKFLIAFFAALGWFAFCFSLSLPWIQDLSRFIGTVFAVTIISFIALIPGFMNMFLLAGYLLDKRSECKRVTTWPDVTVLIPALNEENNIAETVKSIKRQNYLGNIEIIVIDNHSTDNTLGVLKALNIKDLKILQEEKQGKSYALNKGLSIAKSAYIITVDSDTVLLFDALEQLVGKMVTSSENTAAIAGSLYVRNSRQNLLTRMQEWDYFHAITAIKRMQSLFQGTLVAQGAFSIYKKECIEALGGWAPTVGEDIVLTWGFLLKKYRIDFAENAIAFTTVPPTYKAFFFQRSRWARGMIEAFLKYPKLLVTPRLIVFLIYWNLLFPLIDSSYFFIFIPGSIAALFGYYFIAGPMILAVLPIAILLHAVFFSGQRKIFQKHKLKIRKNIMGFFIYMLFFYLIMVPACIHGYLLEIFGRKKKWNSQSEAINDVR